MAYKLSPVAKLQQFFDNQGYPLSGGKLFTYSAGSFSNLQTTYSDDEGTPNTNPIVLDSSGRIGTAIWLPEGSYYQFVLTKADGTTVLMSLDNIGYPGE